MNNENNKSAKYLSIASPGGAVEFFNGDNFDETFEYAVKLTRSDQLQKGIYILEFLEGMRPDDPRVLKELTLALIVNDEPEDSLQFIERLKQVWPDHAITAVLLGMACEKLGRKSDASQALEKALMAKLTDMESTKYIIALAMELNEQISEAKRLVRKIQETDPDDHFAWLALGNIRRLQGDKIGAIDALTHAMETSQTDIQGLETLKLLLEIEL